MRINLYFLKLTGLINKIKSGRLAKTADRKSPVTLAVKVVTEKNISGRT